MTFLTLSSFLFFTVEVFLFSFQSSSCFCLLCFLQKKTEFEKPTVHCKKSKSLEIRFSELVFFIGAIIATTDYHAPFFSLYSFLFFLFLSYHTVCVFSSFLSRHFCLSLSLSFYVSVCLLQVYSSLVVQLAALVATYLSISLVCLPRRRREEKFSLSLSPSHTHTHTHPLLCQSCVLFSACFVRPSVRLSVHRRLELQPNSGDVPTSTIKSLSPYIVHV